VGVCCVIVVVGQTIADYGINSNVALSSYALQASFQSLQRIRLKTVGMYVPTSSRHGVAKYPIWRRQQQSEFPRSSPRSTSLHVSL
jgi:hypothetical protein